ncbi:MAG TPA: NAD(P)H nitroreductase [Mycobacterium sp.]|nr:NAD(P)H nitroreductase [Mycobacterium sp.]HUH68271.1 NAD(P)H nitroreductase [Mycobacterium sp.]
MSEDFPDAQTLHAVLSQAIRAPSIHNSQPWRWRVGNSRLHLYADPDVQLPSIDPDGRDRMVSCGAALHHCVIALAAVGWRAQVRRFPNPADPDHLAAMELFRAPITASDIALSAAAQLRRTDRRRYSDQPMPAVTIDAICAGLSHIGVTVREVRSLPRLRRIVALSVRQHTADHDYLVELNTWSRRHACSTGVLARNAALTDPAEAIPGRSLAGGVVAGPHGAETGDDNGVVLALGTSNDCSLARLRAGEATSVVLLRATMSGLATCPVTEPLEIAETREVVQREVFADKASPQMLLRIGWAPADAEPLPLTPRRPLHDVVEDLGWADANAADRRTSWAAYRRCAAAASGPPRTDAHE